MAQRRTEPSPRWSTQDVQILRRIPSSPLRDEREELELATELVAHVRHRVVCRACIAAGCIRVVFDDEFAALESLAFGVVQPVRIAFAMGGDDQMTAGSQHPEKLIHPGLLQLLREVGEY